MIADLSVSVFCRKCLQGSSKIVSVPDFQPSWFKHCDHVPSEITVVCYERV